MIRFINTYSVPEETTDREMFGMDLTCDKCRSKIKQMYELVLAYEQEPHNRTMLMQMSILGLYELRIEEVDIRTE